MIETEASETGKTEGLIPSTEEEVGKCYVIPDLGGDLGELDLAVTIFFKGFPGQGGTRINECSWLAF